MANIQRRTRNREWDPFALTRNFFGLEPIRFQLAYPDKADDKATFLPKFDVKETETEFILSADLPGVNQEAVDLSLDKNRLTISGSRNAEKREDGESYHLYERSYGSFARTFALPENVDAESIVAALDNGVLTVKLPKVAEAQPRKISLNQ